MMNDPTPAAVRSALKAAVARQLLLLRDARACGLTALARRRRRRLRDLRARLAALQGGRGTHRQGGGDGTQA
jgi:hypothetical protein